MKTIKLGWRYYKIEKVSYLLIFIKKITSKNWDDKFLSEGVET